ncbi:trans-sulfuration enzyme family protein [Bacillus testis]|uniref:trans-sulfuration enzyme family protein n=1 Tax=Bacillus testis TaxID=1622072 RepID=UPI00067F5DE2|nr:PLP-dependent aspartate aminotransferase family protein [Bacillus testis]
MKTETKLVQAGVKKDAATGALSTPIYQCATFEHPELGKSTGFDYSRTANPTRQALEEAIAALEEGDRGFAFSSGMAAITAIMFLFKPGDHIIISDDLYGGTYRLLEETFRIYGIHASYVDTTSIEKIKQSITDRTAAIFIETPSNPLMKVTDLEAVCSLAKGHSILTICDNTFLTPYLQKPITFGFDLVVHSASKYLGGHNDIIGGLVVAAHPELSEKIAKLQNGTGGILGPQDSWLCLRGLKTLAVRMDKQQQNAAAIAKWLENHDAVESVYYPGSSTHPQYELSVRQSKGFGAMLSFELKDEAAAAGILKHVKLISFAESLGGVESLITYPATQTHADIPAAIREEKGISSRLLRMSVGIEHADDLIKDLEQALSLVTQAVLS